MQVSMGWTGSKLTDEYIAAAQSRYGIEYTTDLTDFKTVDKIAKFPKWINPKDGTRSDAATAFLDPVRNANHPNLHLLKTKVSRVLFDGKRAVGVEVIGK